ncbi:hypothetical protein ANO11243_027580 [Dothideomycetidae sp. 11243]|nr:hypothetical protein ANO11243_027580 [fungal sp. No.11243]
MSHTLHHHLNDSDLIKPTGGLGHSLPLDDPENPQNWPLAKKVYTSAASMAAAFAVAFAATIYTAGLKEIIMRFQVSMTVAILGFSLFLIGVAFSPIHTPHLSERFGRRIVYLISLPLCALFLIGTGTAQNFAILAVCRFFAGLCGGPCLVLIEGTFADLWSPVKTVSYYSVLALASYIGTAAGPLVGGFVVTHLSWRWTSWIPMMLIAAVLIFSFFMPETYGREILRRRARKQGIPHNLPKAESGVTLGEMAKVTVVQPVVMFFTDPITFLTTIYVSFLFGTIFQWFIAVPAVLGMVYHFTLESIGLAFISAITGALLAMVSSMLIESLAARHKVRRGAQEGLIHLEDRWLPAVMGSLLVTAAFFWIGWTAKPSVSWASPVVGTGVYVWGNVMILVRFLDHNARHIITDNPAQTSIISYLFDAFPPAATLSSLTMAATMRLLVAAAIPLVIIQDITALGGGWAYSIFGFIAAALIIVPIVGYKFGAQIRAKSRYTGSMAVMSESKDDPERNPVTA